MWPVSARFLETIAGPHTVISKVDVYRDGELLQEDLPIVSGSVRADENSRVRRSASLVIGDSNLAPTDGDSLLAPVGTDLVISAGVKYRNDNQELVPVGTFRIQETNVDSWSGNITIEASDYMSVVADDRFLVPRSVAAGTVIVDEISDIVVGTLPDTEIFDITGSDDIVAAALTWDRDRDVAIEDLAKAIGAEAFFDVQGRFIIRPVPEVDSDALTGAWTIEGGDTGVLADVGQSMSRAGIYNGVVASGTTTDSTTSPPTAFAVISTGPYAWNGSFGRKPKFYASPLITTTTQALSAARKVLARQRGLQRTLAPTVVRNPALQAGDLIIVRLPDGNVSYHIVSGFELPLGPGTMALTLRAQVETDEETL